MRGIDQLGVRAEVHVNASARAGATEQSARARISLSLSHLHVPHRVVGLSYRSPFVPMARPFRSQLRVVSKEDETEDFGRGCVVVSASRCLCKKIKPGEALDRREDQSSRDDSRRELVMASFLG